MLMSPDSSMNSSTKMLPHTTTIQLGTVHMHQTHNVHHAAPTSTMDCVQVQECTQSQTLAAPAPPPLASVAAGPRSTILASTLQQKQQLLPPLASDSPSIGSFFDTPQLWDDKNRQPLKTIATTGHQIQLTPVSQPTTHSLTQQQQQSTQNNVIYKIVQRPNTPDYPKTYPLMDTTVASSVKGEPELNIGMFINHRSPVTQIWTGYYHGYSIHLIFLKWRFGNQTDGILFRSVSGLNLAQMLFDDSLLILF